jgi:hypothetical protein
MLLYKRCIYISITPCFLSRDGDRREMERDSMATSPVNHRLLAVAGDRRERCSSILARRLVIRRSNSALSRPTCLYQYLDVQQPPASVDFYCWMWMLGVAQSPSSLLATAPALPYAFVLHTQKTPFFSCLSGG